MNPTTPLPIALVLSYPKDTPIPLVQGTVKKQRPRTTNKPGQKPWTCDFVTIADHSGEVELKIWNRPPMPNIPLGTQVLVGCSDGKQNVTLDYYNREDGSITKSLRVEATGFLQFGGAPAQTAAPVAAPWPTPLLPSTHQPAPPAPVGPAPLAYVAPPPDFNLPYPPPEPQALQQIARTPVHTQPATTEPQEDPIAHANRRVLELGGLQYQCMRVVRHNLSVLASDGIGIDFTGDNITSAAAVLMIQLSKEGITGTGFTIPTLPTPQADS